MSSSSSIIIDSDDSDEDFELPPYTKKFKSTSNKGNEMNSIIVNEIKGIRSDLNFITKLKQEDKVPVALKKLLHDAFTCHICQSTPMTPPLIFARCCKRVIGCQVCVDTWYRGDVGMTKRCPICRHDRGYSETFIIRGMDEFMNGIKPIFENRRQSEPENENDD